MKKLCIKYWQMLPNVEWSNLLLRIPLAIVFIQQGLGKLPFDASMAIGLGLPVFVWWVVIIAEISSGAGLILSGLLSLTKLNNIPLIATFGDVVTRFSGIVMCCVATGVIWITKPESLTSVLLYQNLHVFLWFGGLYFALRGTMRGNWAVTVNEKHLKN